MNLLRIDGYSQQIILGVVIIAAIFPDDRASEEMAKKMEESLPLAINCDMGEGFGLYHMGDDERMMPHITVASVVNTPEPTDATFTFAPGQPSSK